MRYTELVGHIEQVHDAWYIEATKAINVALTLRNWMIGYYILEYEQDGEDRIGILFVTEKNRALVEYATAGMDERLFVKQYLVSLPDKSKMEDLIAKEINKI